jgi:uncharacterized heparinase superfamily protein
MQNERAVVLADVGAVAPAYIPGHAHAGTLSFEMSVDGVRVLVNSGISTYENDAERFRQRGTAAHNSVEVEGKNSSDVWSAFRVGRRVSKVRLDFQLDNTYPIFEATHDGYSGLGVQHQRAWRLANYGLEVRDRVTGKPCRARAYFHWSPKEFNRLILHTWQKRVIKDSTWHPGFNITQSSKCDVVEFSDEVITELHW